jgi:hypothetical protein
MYNRVCFSAFYGSSARSLTMTSPVFFLHSFPCLAASHQFFVLSNLAASSCTSSSHLIFYLQTGLYPPRLSFRICFWDSVVEPSYYIPSLNWYLFDPFILLLSRNVVNGTEQNNGATERNSISQIITAWGFCLSIVRSSFLRFGERSLMHLLGEWVKNKRIWKYSATAYHNFSGIPRPALYQPFTSSLAKIF